ncbi:DNA polymerase III subunit gamma/tau [Limnobacter humi]|uniref:DNA polymerase III subunit gamma/tau n=1 Tax=Limnobacter humi TaxID=1778671 RepID=A0ABT1WC46_9BURK|nr:DNA polymerase III subunit gamma/tau [Limnobacter humi]MCQ8894944.1 DNA polymerase III subunit gamma/tau [Limnobacter humi]
MTQTASQALARKWRPRDFDSLVGQDHVVRALSHALENQRLHHAYLFTGTRGVGKTTIARILARAVNCERGISKNPCGQCQACLEISQGRFVDLLEVDAATNTRVDEMRALLENAMYAPTAGRYKVYVIDEVHMLSTSAFNAMLKTLEEPPGHVLFILATTDPQKIPATVLSRCLQFGLRNLPPDLLADHLGHILKEEGIAHEPGALRLLAKAARGSVRDALSLTDQAIAYSAGTVGEAVVRQMLGSVDQQVVLQILNALASGDGKALLDIARGLAAVAAPFPAILDELAAVAYRLSVAVFAGGLNSDDPDDAALTGLQQTLTPEDLQLIYQIATHARADLHLAPEESIGFSMALIRMLAFKPGGQAPVVANAPARPLAPPVVATSVPVQEMPLAKPVVVEASPAFTGSAVEPDLPTPESWPLASQQIPAKGLTRQALVQAELVSVAREGAGIQFHLRTAIRPYTDASMVSRIEGLLSAHYGAPVKVTMTLGEAQQTAHAVHSENRRQAMEGAKKSLDEDPFLKGIQNLMGATVVPGSERTLNDIGPADV